MKPSRFAIATLAFAIGLYVESGIAQTEGGADSTATIVYIETSSGGTITGTIIEQSDTTLTVRDKGFGTVVIERSNISLLERRDSSRYRHEEYWYENPASTRYLLGPSAFPIGNGEGYYQNTYLLLNTFYVGAGDYLTIGGGFEILTLSMGNPVFFITPKFSIPVSEGLAFGGGVAIAAIPSAEVLAGIGYGLVTVGNRDDNATLGLGYGWSDGEGMERPIITISGMVRASRSIALVSENWFIPDGNSTYTMLSYAIRFLAQSMAVDVGFLNNGEIAKSFFLGIPYVDLMVRF